MRARRIIGLVMTVALLCAAMVFPVQAEELSVFDMPMRSNGAIKVDSVIANSSSDALSLSVSLENVANVAALQFDLIYSGGTPGNVTATSKLSGKSSVRTASDGIHYAFASKDANANPSAVLDLKLNPGSGTTTLTFENVKAWDYNGSVINLNAESGSIQLITSVDGLKVEPDTTAASLKSKLGVGCQVFKAGGAELADTDYVGTGCIVRLSSGSETTVLIKGDVDGDGRVQVTDILEVQNYILGRKALEGVYFKAAEVSGDGKIDVVDILDIQNHILGRTPIEQ